MENKTKVIYDKWNPNEEGATFVAIQTENNPPYVWRVYFKGELLPNLPHDMLMAPIRAARNLFDFKEGKLADIVRE